MLGYRTEKITLKLLPFLILNKELQEQLKIKTQTNISPWSQLLWSATLFWVFLLLKITYSISGNLKIIYPVPCPIIHNLMIQLTTIMCLNMFLAKKISSVLKARQLLFPLGICYLSICWRLLCSFVFNGFLALVMTFTYNLVW